MTQKNLTKITRIVGCRLIEPPIFDWETALYFEDVRHSYPERRFIAMGYLEERLHVLCFASIKGGVRIISFRKANLREVKRYEKETLTNKAGQVRELNT